MGKLELKSKERVIDGNELNGEKLKMSLCDSFKLMRAGTENRPYTCLETEPSLISYLPLTYAALVVELVAY